MLQCCKCRAGHCDPLTAETVSAVPCCRDTRALLATGNEADAQAFITDNSHKRLWQLLAEHALQKLDLPTAEKAFVHCNDYQGVQLVKHLGQLGEKNKQMAEVSRAIDVQPGHSRLRSVLCMGDIHCRASNDPCAGISCHP